MSELREEIASLSARVKELEATVQDLGSRLRAVEATLERAERAAIRREEQRWSTS